MAWVTNTRLYGLTQQMTAYKMQMNKPWRVYFIVISNGTNEVSAMPFLRQKKVTRKSSHFVLFNFKSNYFRMKPTDAGNQNLKKKHCKICKWNEFRLQIFSISLCSSFFLFAAAAQTSFEIHLRFAWALAKQRVSKTSIFKCSMVCVFVKKGFLIWRVGSASLVHTQMKRAYITKRGKCCFRALVHVSHEQRSVCEKLKVRCFSWCVLVFVAVHFVHKPLFKNAEAAQFERRKKRRNSLLLSFCSFCRF